MRSMIEELTQEPWKKDFQGSFRVFKAPLKNEVEMRKKCRKEGLWKQKQRLKA